MNSKYYSTHYGRCRYNVRYIYVKQAACGHVLDPKEDDWVGTPTLVYVGCLGCQQSQAFIDDLLKYELSGYTYDMWHNEKSDEK